MRNSKLVVPAIVLALLVGASLVVSRSGERAATPELATAPLAERAPSVGPLDAVAPTDDAARTALVETASIPAATTSALDATADERFVHGRVVDADRTPVAGAEVALLLRPAGDFALLIDHAYVAEVRTVATLVTDASGAFRFEVEPARTYALRVRATGWCERQLDGVGAGPAIEVVLSRGAELAVDVVRASDGAAIADAVVVLLHDELEQNPESRTDARGRARFVGIPAGAARVLAVPANEASSGVEVEIAAGAVRELRIEVADGFTVEGRVRERGSGRPIADAEVSAWSFLHKNVRTDALGRYRIHGVGPGGVDFATIAARAPGFGRAQRRVTLASGTEPVCDLELTPALVLRGRIVDGERAPIAGAYVAAVGVGFQQTVRLRDDVSTRSGADGRFELANVSRELGHALFVRAHGRETRTLDVVVPEPATGPIDVGDVVMRAQSSLEGRVVDSAGESIENALIVLRHLGAAPLAAQAGLDTQHVSTDVHGRFRAADLAAGKHEIRVVISGYSELRTGVELAAGEVRRGLELVLAGGGVIAGQVVDSDGGGVPDAEVRVAGPDGPRSSWRGRTKADGSFRIEGLPDEELRVDAQRYDPLETPGGETVWLLASAVVEVRPWTTDLRLTLPPADVIEGRVLDVDGASLVGGCVEAFDADGRVLGQAAARDGAFRLLVPRGAVVRLVGFRRSLGGDGRFTRVPMPGESAVVEGVRGGARDVVVRFVREP